MSAVNMATVLMQLAKAPLKADLMRADGRRLGQEKKLVNARFANDRLVADDVTFFALPARVSALVILLDGQELATITGIIDASASPVGGDLLVPLSGGFLSA